MRAQTVSKGKTVAIDFDGVIHSYTRGWTGLIPQDPPMPGVEEGLKALKDLGYRLTILSTRPPQFIKPWLKKYGLDKYITTVTSHKVPAEIYIDDRGYRFENWGDTVNFVQHLKPKKK